MPRRSRSAKIDPVQLRKIEEGANSLRNAIGDAQRSLIPFCPHYEALLRLAGEVHRALNVLNDRPEDWSDYSGAMDAMRDP